MQKSAAVCIGGYETGKVEKNVAYLKKSTVTYFRLIGKHGTTYMARDMKYKATKFRSVGSKNRRHSCVFIGVGVIGYGRSALVCPLVDPFGPESRLLQPLERVLLRPSGTVHTQHFHGRFHIQCRRPHS